MKNRLTKSQLEKLVREQLTDEVRQQIDEGIWDSIKYGIAKLGSLEASGKLLGKGKIRKAAQDKLEAALDKHSNKAVKDLVDAIKADEDTKEFPNMKDQFAFQSALASILVYYDSLKAAVEKYQPGKEKQPEGAMSPEAANAIIEVLHQYLVNTMDNKLSDVYKHFKESLEEEGQTLAEIIAEQEEEGDEGEKPEEESFYDKKSTTMAGLESNFLPAALSLLGGAAYTAGQVVAATAPLMYTKDFITDPGKITQVPGATKEYFDAVVDSRGKGMLKTFSDSASALSGETVRPMEFAKSVDIIAQETGSTPEEVIKDVMGTLGREEHRNVSGELSTLMYNYAKEGGSVGDVVNATAIKPEFVEFAKESGASDALVSKFEAAEKAAAAAKDAAKQAASSAASDAATSLPDADDVAGAAKDATKQAAATAADSPDEIPASMAKAMKDQARGSSTSLGVKSFNAAEAAAAKEEFVKQKGTFKDYFNNFKANNPEEFEKMKKGAFGPGQTLKRRYEQELRDFMMKPFMKKIKEQAGAVALGSGAVKDAGITLLGMEPGGAVMNLAGKVATSAAKTAVKQGAVTAGTKAAALVPGLGATLAPMGLAVAGGGLAIKLLRMKGKKSSRAADLQTARDYIKKFPVEDPVLDPEGATGGGGEDAPPVAGEPEGEEKDFAAVARMDDDGLKISVSKARSQKSRERDIETFKKAQDQAITGRNTDPSSDDIATKHGIKPRKPDVKKLSHAQMQKAMKGKSKKPGEGFLTVDASIYKDLSKAIRQAGGQGFRASGTGAKQIKSIVKVLLDRLTKNDKKQTAGQARVVVNNLLKKIGFDIEKDQMGPIIDVLQDYGLVRTGDETGGKKTRSKRTKGRAGKKRAPATSPATDDGDDEPTVRTKKQGSVLDDLLGVDSGIKNQRSRGARAKVRPPTDAGTMRRRRKTRGGRALEEQSDLNETLKKWAKIAGILQEKNDD